MARIITIDRIHDRDLVATGRRAVQQRCGERGAEDARLVELHHLFVAHRADALARCGTAVVMPDSTWNRAKKNGIWISMGKAGRERVGAVLLVHGHLFLRHGLAGQLVGLALVLVLQLLQIGLQELHAALGLDLLDEHGNQGGTDHQHQPDDGQRPRPAIGGGHADGAQAIVEDHHNGGHKPLERKHDCFKEVHTISLFVRPQSGLLHQSEQPGTCPGCSAQQLWGCGPRATRICRRGHGPHHRRSRDGSATGAWPPASFL